MTVPFHSRVTVWPAPNDQVSFQVLTVAIAAASGSFDGC